MIVFSCITPAAQMSRKWYYLHARTSPAVFGVQQGCQPVFAKKDRHCPKQARSASGPPTLTGGPPSANLFLPWLKPLVTPLYVMNMQLRQCFARAKPLRLIKSQILTVATLAFLKPDFIWLFLENKKSQTR